MLTTGSGPKRTWHQFRPAFVPTVTSGRAQRILVSISGIGPRADVATSLPDVSFDLLSGPAVTASKVC